MLETAPFSVTEHRLRPPGESQYTLAPVTSVSPRAPVNHDFMFYFTKLDFDILCFVLRCSEAGFLSVNPATQSVEQTDLELRPTRLSASQVTHFFLK